MGNIYPATGLERQESIFKTVESFMNLRYRYYSARTRGHAECMNRIQKLSVPPKLKGRTVKGLETPARGALENTGDLACRR